jgi:aldehyde dehydrogenase (NAD+)
VKTNNAERLGLLIDGVLKEANSRRWFESIDPATEAVTASVPDADASDMDHAIAAARRTFDQTSWSTDRPFRRRCLEQLQAGLEKHREEIREALIAEVGAPLQTTYGPQLDLPLSEAISWPARYIDRFAWERDEGDSAPFGIPSRRLVLKEPMGVVGAITPWNYPVEILLSKLGPILATGNTVVVKPAPDSPVTALIIARLIAEESDIPAGVVNVITASDHSIGEQLAMDPRVDAISFTGSTSVGRHLMAIGAPTLKRLFLELGGKSAQIVLDEDCDLGRVAAAAPLGSCLHAGQGCAMYTRLLLPRSRYAEAIDLLAESFKSVCVGDPRDPAVICGPVINARQRDRVLNYVDIGVNEGARLVAGGGRPAALSRGFFVEPTLFANVDNSMRIAQEEIFGPVLVVIPHDGDDDAVRLANDSPYGLSGSVTSTSLDRAMAVARRVRTGTMNVNGGVFVGPDIPFGGYKASGLGRQNGLEGFEQYLETKSLGLPRPA